MNRRSYVNFNVHSNLKDQHAFLSPSKYHWVNYSDEKLQNTFLNYRAAAKGVRLHEFARECIELKIMLPETRNTLNMYVNDAIIFDMTPELILYYSDNCFGTTDSISFNNDILRIHDFKSGITPANMAQLEVYTALFCLEYDVNISDIQIELRIYQFDDILVYEPTPEDIKYICNKIIEFDKQIEVIKKNTDL